MNVPLNGAGIADGSWLRWAELEAWLRSRGHAEVADLIAATIADDGATLEQRCFTVRA
jgi:hypothetical protein